MTKREVLEGEVISRSNSREKTKSIFEADFTLPVVTKTIFWLLLLAFVPVIGFLISIFSFIIARIQQKSILIPVIALVISSFVTGTFLILRFIIRAIF